MDKKAWQTIDELKNKVQHRILKGVVFQTVFEWLHKQQKQ